MGLQQGAGIVGDPGVRSPRRKFKPPVPTGLLSGPMQMEGLDHGLGVVETRLRDTYEAIAQAARAGALAIRGSPPCRFSGCRVRKVVEDFFALTPRRRWKGAGRTMAEQTASLPRISTDPAGSERLG